MSPDLETRVMATNPVRDDQLELVFGDDASRRLLREIRHRRVANMPASDDKVRELNPPNEEASGRRPAWVAAAGAAAVVLVVIGVVAVVRSDDGVPAASEPVATTAAPASTSPEAVTTAAPEPVDPIAVVTSSIDASNEGDMEAWLAHFSEDAIIAGFRKGDAAEAFAPLFVAAGHRTLTGDCEVRPDAETTTVECPVIDTNDFQAALGIEFPRRVAYVVGPSGQILFMSGGGEGDYRAISRHSFNFWLWFEDAHPDIYASIDDVPVDDGTHLGYGGRFPRTAADMELALQYVDEFVAQSDRYPLAADG